MSSRPVHPFTPTSRDLWRIALPASFAFITEPLVGFVDLTVIGRLGDPDRLGGLVLGALAFDLLFSLVYFLRISTAGLTAQAVGARDPDDGLLHLVRAALLGCGLGVLLIVLTVPLQLGLGAILAPPPSVRPAFDTYFRRAALLRPALVAQLCPAGLVLWAGRGNHRHGPADARQRRQHRL